MRQLAAASETPVLPRKMFVIDCVTAEKRGWVKVRWQGYHPSWEEWRIEVEVGSPLETWEPWKRMKTKEACAIWTAAQAQTALKQQ